MLKSCFLCPLDCKKLSMSALSLSDAVVTLGKMGSRRGLGQKIKYIFLKIIFPPGANYWGGFFLMAHSQNGCLVDSASNKIT